jgi:transposase InsO family protein
LKFYRITYSPPL